MLTLLIGTPSGKRKLHQKPFTSNGNAFETPFKLDITSLPKSMTSRSSALNVIRKNKLVSTHFFYLALLEPLGLDQG